MKDLVAQFLFSALHNLFQAQPDLSRFVTQETREREPNLSFHLANELWEYLFWLNCDFDITKGRHDDKRPDIVFHKRASNASNFLVVEVKRRSNSDGDDGIEADIRKIRSHWFRGELCYRFGASVVIDEQRGHYQVRLLERGEQAEMSFSQSCQHLLIAEPKFTRVRRSTIEKIAARIVAGDSNPAQTLRSTFDQRLIALYER